MVSLALVSIIAGIAVVNYTQQIPRYELREAGRDLTAQLRLLRQTAITEGLRHEISFDVNHGTYKTENLGEQDLPSHVKFGLPDHVPLKNGGVYASEDDATNFHDHTASFKPNGLPGSLGALHMTNAPFRNEAIAITVSSTGRVKLFEWNGSEWQ